MHILRGSTRDLSLGRQVVLPKRQRPRLQGLSAPLRFFFKAFLHDSIAVWMCFYLYTRSILLMYLYFSFWVSCICLLSMGYVSSESLDAKTYKEKLSCKNIWLYVYWLCSKWRIIYVFFLLKSKQNIMDPNPIADVKNADFFEDLFLVHKDMLSHTLQSSHTNDL